MGTPTSMARIAPPLRKAPIAPVAVRRPSGKIITDPLSRSRSFRYSRCCLAPPPRGIGKAATATCARRASHLRLKIESAAATTTERCLYRGGRASARTTASRALTWFATKTAGPVRSRSSSRSRTLSRQKLDRAGNSRLDCSAARIRRIPFVRAHKAVSTASPFMVGMSVGAPGGVRRLIRDDVCGPIAERMQRHSRQSPQQGDRDPHSPGDVQHPAGDAEDRPERWSNNLKIGKDRKPRRPQRRIARPPSQPAALKGGDPEADQKGDEEEPPDAGSEAERCIREPKQRPGRGLHGRGIGARARVAGCKYLQHGQKADVVDGVKSPEEQRCNHAKDRKPTIAYLAQCHVHADNKGRNRDDHQRVDPGFGEPDR